MRPCERRPGERAPSLLFLSMVGARGFEPPTSWSRTKRANQAALRPERFLSGSRVGRHHTPAPRHVRNEGNFNTFPSSRQTRKRSLSPFCDGPAPRQGARKKPRPFAPALALTAANDAAMVFPSVDRSEEKSKKNQKGGGRAHPSDEGGLRPGKPHRTAEPEEQEPRSAPRHEGPP